ncbi:rod shape-determining protein MreC [Sulfurimonas autotrophica]|uniref:Putative periplasmic protein n=1 Tax=Sulfurimonas autotrophica (strain ATCC BAA-671 / DSM 16294 / JCM 11897 / OK10) TaxID=563040 RepID=E0UUM1_SULAO|nr:rod shape-determining protein MreC [Sulfurimonas autotrophica]ADN09525.1 putative periplasmic protein [Sulfurimonas autotrophica DSM 16294]
MNKKSFSYFFIIMALFVGALYYNNLIQSPIISALNSIKSSYLNTLEFFENKIDKHIFQAQEIENLKNQLQKYENNHLVMQQLASELNDIYKENNSSLKTNPNVELVRAVSYEKFGNLNRLWMDIPDYNASKIYGLTYKELVAGIVIDKNNKPLALLNSDIKSAYSVYVGEKKAPGIAHGNNAKNIVINFIPAWFNIKQGDEVLTSGLDNIFFKGLKVGKIISVTKSQGYQNAVVEQYYKANEPSYFHMIRSVK